MNTKPTTSPYLTRRLRTLEEVLADRYLRSRPAPFVPPTEADNDNGGAIRKGAPRPSAA